MIRRSHLLALPLVTAAALAASGPALAASDYLLNLDGTVAGAGGLQVESWSWGETNPGSTRGSLSVRTAREAGSGMATGRSAACAAGKHYPTATLSRGAESWSLRDVVVSGCADGTMTLTYSSAARATKTRSNIQNN